MIDKLRFNKSQSKAYEGIEQARKDRIPYYAIWLKSRQRGFSTLAGAHDFVEAYSHDNLEVLMMAQLKDRTEKLFQMLHMFLKNLPEDLQLPLKRSTRQEIGWNHNNSTIALATAGTTAASRGGNYQRVHLSEAAFYSDLYQLLGALSQGVSEAPGVSFIIESTANGVGNEFHGLWQAAEAGQVRYKPLFFNWYEDEDTIVRFTSDRAKDAFKDTMYSQYPELKDRAEHYGIKTERMAWYYNKLIGPCQGDEILCMQEYPMDPAEAFISTGIPIFPMAITTEMRKWTRNGVLYDVTLPFSSFEGLVRAPELKREKDSYLEVWSEPRASRSYLISADPARGFEDSDFSSAFVFDMFSLNTVAEVHGRFEPDVFAKILAQLGTVYNNAIVAPEIEMSGLACLFALRDIYTNIYQWRQMKGYTYTISPYTLGWSTNSQSRPIMLTEAKRMLRLKHKEKDTNFIPSRHLLDEMKTFVISNLAMKPVAASGCFDDRVMAWAIGIICCLQETGISTDTGLITGSSTNMAPGGIITPSQTLDMIMSEDWTGQSFSDFYGGMS